jgi:GH25 family lysozyme M1 (1,4-beta-N-acetylmuramidase)
MTLLLPDVSEFQPHTDMRGVKAANGGAAIVRACYGTSHPDAVFAKLRAAASGFAFLGLYQYLTAAQDAAAQAHKFVQMVGHLGQHEVPILDLEEGIGNQAARANAWFGVVDDAFGLTPLPLNKRSWLYSGQSFASTAGLAPVFRSARRTWVAAYRDSDTGLLPHTLWQSTNGVVGANHGVSWPGAGHCDTNVYHGTLPQLAEVIRRC